MWEHIGAWYDERTGRVGGEVGGLEKDLQREVTFLWGRGHTTCGILVLQPEVEPEPQQ